MAPQQRLFSEADAALVMGITQRQLRDMRYRREIPYVKVGRLVRFDGKVIDRYIAAKTIAAAS